MAMKKIAKPVVKKAATKEKNDVTVKFGRFGEDPQTVKVQTGGTVKDVLTKVGVEIGTKEKVWVNGTKADATTEVKTGDIVAVVSPKEAGLS